MTAKPPKRGENDLPAVPINLRVEVKRAPRLVPVLPRPMPDAEVCNRLLDALEKAAVDSSHSMEALRVAVCDFTVALRHRGTTPEGVLISLKSVINHRIIRPSSHPFSSNRGDPEIHDKISTWSIQEFFREMAEG